MNESLKKISIRRVIALSFVGIAAFLIGTLFMLQTDTNEGVVLGASTQNFPNRFWRHQCIDTMKYSRDTARAWKDRPEVLQSLVDKQMTAIADIGANCVAIGTPYEEEFVPFMKVWVNSAREHGLHIWYRGNVAGFEGWFEYKPLKSLAEHHQRVYSFIINNPELFQDGDIFTPSPESENKLLRGGWTKENVTGLKSFIIDAYDNCERAFKYINKPVRCGYFSSNGDVARDAMDVKTVKETGNLIVIDHYIKTVQRMENDILDLYKRYGASVAIGEFGAPIPDINGKMSEEQRESLVGGWLDVFYRHRNIVEAVNYWVLSGGSTSLYTDDIKTPSKVVNVLKKFYKPAQITGRVVDKNNKPIAGIPVVLEYGEAKSQETVSSFDGSFGFLVPAGKRSFTIGGNGYSTQDFTQTVGVGEKTEVRAVLSALEGTNAYRLQDTIKNAFGIYRN